MKNSVTPLTTDPLAERLAGLNVTLGGSPPKQLRSSLDSPRGLLPKSNLATSSEKITEEKSNCITKIDTYDKAIFLFADMQDSSIHSQSADFVESTLNPIIANFINIVQKYRSDGIYIVKFAGDNIMLAAGSKDKDVQAKQAKAMVSIGLEMIEYLRDSNIERVTPINFRIGMNMGRAEKSLYRYPTERGLTEIIDWHGVGVNIASRMESSSIPSQFQVPAETYFLVKDDFTFSIQYVHDVESCGIQTTYIVLGHKQKPSVEPQVSIGYYPSTLARRGSLSTPTLFISPDDLTQLREKVAPK